MLRLERCDPAKNMLRFYALQVAPNLFGEWSLLRVWGRIGRQGQMRTEWFKTKQEAEDALRTLEKAKRKRGYREKQTFPFRREVRS
jgi:predicted DNA-binding WGR domain protein